MALVLAEHADTRGHKHRCLSAVGETAESIRLFYVA